MPTLFHQGHALAFAPGETDRAGAVVGDGGDQHALQFGLVLGGHHGEVGHRPQITDVVLTLVGGSIGADDAGPIEDEGDRQLLDAHIVDELVVGPLQESAVNRHHRPQPLTSHAGGHRYGVLFGDADIEVLIRQSLLQQIQTRACRHGRRDAYHPRIVLADLHQGLAKNLAVASRLRFGGGVGLARGQVEGGLGVVAHLVRFGIGITLALGGGHMHQHRPIHPVGGLEGAHHLGDVVAIDRAHVGEAQFFKHRAQLGHGQTAHALFEVAQLGGQLTVQERQVPNRLLRVAREELHRLAQPHAIQVGGQGSHRRGDRHVVVVEDDKNAGVGQVPGMVDGFESHATGEGAITDDGHTTEAFTASIPGQGHAQGRRDAGGGMACSEMVEGAFAALQVAGYPTLLAQGMESAVATG